MIGGAQSTRWGLLLLPLLTACNDVSTEPGLQAPFRFVVLAGVDGETADLLGDGEAIELSAGDRLLVRLQIVDARGNDTPSQNSTVGRATNPNLVKLGEIFQVSANLLEFFFEATSAGSSTLVFENPQIGISRVILVQIT